MTKTKNQTKGQPQVGWDDGLVRPLSADAKRRKAIAVAKAQVLFVASELTKKTCDDDQAFSHMWRLAWMDLRDLEDFRNGQAH